MTLFQDVRAALGAPHFIKRPRYLRLTVPILKACLDIIAAVQRLDKDCIMKIDGYNSSVIVVVWAYYMPGLTVSYVYFAKDTPILSESCPSVLSKGGKNPSRLLDMQGSSNSQLIVHVVNSQNEPIVIRQGDPYSAH